MAGGSQKKGKGINTQILQQLTTSAELSPSSAISLTASLAANPSLNTDTSWGQRYIAWKWRNSNPINQADCPKLQVITKRKRTHPGPTSDSLFIVVGPLIVVVCGINYETICCKVGVGQAATAEMRQRQLTSVWATMSGGEKGCW